ncbi:uncharacterized protein LOC131996824 [Stomoxys calcitrans]|uniref:uncharacterized protein LOC131996824 n=1 Tax=Stomoxys calcitrans TaxID=35570 RepID=UPI0027E288B3|nr:uncharacterized protein LOC131996824 [Stomoxys calcitrans]
MPAHELYKCLLCQKRHALKHCPRFILMTVEDRRVAVRRHEYCRNCLARSHTVEECISSGTCRKCGFQHHTMLHLHNFTVQQKKSHTPTKPARSLQQQAKSAASSKYKSKPATTPSRKSARPNNTARQKSARPHPHQRNNQQRNNKQKQRKTKPKVTKKQQHTSAKKHQAAPQPNYLVLSEAIKSLATVLCASSTHFA